MKRLLLAIVLLAFANCAIAQDYKIFQNVHGGLLYSDDNGEWQTRQSWEKMYGAKRWKEVFRGRTPDHIQEHNYIRYNYIETVKHIGNGQVVWSRVIEDDRQIDELIQRATEVVTNACVDGNVVTGNFSAVNFKSGHRSTYNLTPYLVDGDVRFEFREGRYKITVTNIMWRERKPSTFYASGGSLGVGVNDTNPNRPVYDLLYDSDGVQRPSATYRARVDDIDYTYCEMFILQFLDDNPQNDNDW